MTLYYKIRQVLLQNATAILLQNATEVYYNMRQGFYYKMRRLQIATAHSRKINNDKYNHCYKCQQLGQSREC